MKFKITFISLITTTLLLSQDPADSVKREADTTYWQVKSIFGTNGTQTSFVNWSGGGRNNVMLRLAGGGGERGCK